MHPFDLFREQILGKQISHAWRGVGSAIFLELGIVTPHLLENGQPGHPDGETSIMLQWSWRIEKPCSIAGGSWSGEKKITNLVNSLIGHSITDAEIVGRLPELHLTLSGGLHVLSFMTAEGQPDWAIICNTLGQSLCVKRGKLAIESHAT